MVNFELNESVLNTGITGDIYINSCNSYLNDNFDFDEFYKFLESVLIESDSKHERECAAKAKELAKNHDKIKLKQLISENKSAFTSGTFATLAGGILLEMIKKVLNF